MRRGFTFIELMIVLAIISILATLLLMSTGKARAKAKFARVSTELSEISTSVTQFAADNNYQYPPDVDRSVPPGLQPYLTGGVWPKSVYPNGVFDWDNWLHPVTGEQIYQITYRFCNLGDPSSYCNDPILFPNFTSKSGIIYCISGPCIPHQDDIYAPAYCVNCTPKKMNY